MVKVHPSATVILLREAENKIEFLLLRRNPRISFHGGAWVFPGGKIDPDDYDNNNRGDMILAARNAAVREAGEEAGLRLNPEELVLASVWTTPEGMSKRFITWFFVGATDRGDVKIDGSEIHDYQWIAPDIALELHSKNKLELPPPTFVTICKLSAYNDIDTLLSSLAGSEPEIYVPRVFQVDGGRCSLYQDDVGYHDGNMDRPGARHRLRMLESGWTYVKSV